MHYVLANLCSREIEPLGGGDEAAHLDYLLKYFDAR
jgi:hypothetical protein